MEEIKGDLNKAGNVILDSSGDGTITFDVDNAWQRWVIKSVVVSTSQSMSQSPYPTAEVFCGPLPAPNFSQGATSTGNQDTFTGTTNMDDGSTLFVVFAGGISGTKATARVYGDKYTRRS